jgi:hypothetical protein
LHWDRRDSYSNSYGDGYGYWDTFTYTYGHIHSRTDSYGYSDGGRNTFRDTFVSAGDNRVEQPGNRVG